MIYIKKYGNKELSRWSSIEIALTTTLDTTVLVRQIPITYGYHKTYKKQHLRQVTKANFEPVRIISFSTIQKLLIREDASRVNGTHKSS